MAFLSHSLELDHLGAYKRSGRMTKYLSAKSDMLDVPSRPHYAPSLELAGINFCETASFNPELVLVSFQQKHMT